MKKFLIVLLILVVLGVGLWYTVEPKLNRNQASQPSEEAAIPTANSISATNQPASDAILVASADLTTNGFITIHRKTNGVPSGDIYAVSSLVYAGNHTNVVIPTKLPPDTYYALIFADTDANGVFNFEYDMRMANVQSEFLEVEFALLSQPNRTYSALADTRPLFSVPAVEGIKIQNSSPKPATITVLHGTKVAFINFDAVPHHFVGDGSVFDTNTIEAQSLFVISTKTMTLGAHPYHDILNPSVKGVIIIK